MFGRISILAIIAIGLASTSFAQPEGFHKGTLIPEFGPVASIENRDPIPEGTAFKISFDIVERSDAGTLNRNLVAAARFLNMHTEAGIPLEDMSLAIVIHGSAVVDVTNAAHFDSFNEAPNANAALVAELLKHGVEIHVCGQSAAFLGIKTENLLRGVRMSLSAMTAHALLQQDGYTLNPF